MSRLSFTTDGSGRWWVREWQAPCCGEVSAFGACQGVDGHDGDHWCYSASGGYIHVMPDGSLSMVPPDHKNYRTPLDMSKLRPQPGTWVEVTDAAELARLNAGKLRPGESATRPPTVEEVKKFREEEGQ